MIPKQIIEKTRKRLGLELGSGIEEEVQDLEKIQNVELREAVAQNLFEHCMTLHPIEQAEYFAAIGERKKAYSLASENLDSLLDFIKYIESHGDRDNEKTLEKGKKNDEMRDKSLPTAVSHLPKMIEILKRENNVKSEQEEQNARIENALTPIIYMYIGPKRFTFSSDHNLEEFECSNIVEAAEIYKGLDFINTALDILMKDDLTNPYLEKHPNIKKSFSHGMMKRVFALGEKTGYVSTMDFWKNFLEYSIRDKSVGGYLFKLREEKRRSDNVPEGVLEAVRDDSGLMQKLEEKLKKDIEKGHIRDIEYIEELSDGKFKVTREERIGMGDMNAQKKKWSEAMECYPDGEYGKFADTYKSEIQERIRTKSEFESEHDLFDLNRDFLKLAIYRLFAGQGEQLEKTIVNHELVFDPVTQVEVLKGIYSGITGAENEYERALGENTPKDFFNQLESAKIKCETVIRVVADELAINQDYESAKNLYNVIGDQEKVKAIGEIEKFWKSKEEDIFKDIPKEERLKVKILYATEPLL